MKTPIKIFISGGLVQRVEDAAGEIIDAEVWDIDTEGEEEGSPHLKADRDGQEFYVYEP